MPAMRSRPPTRSDTRSSSSCAVPRSRTRPSVVWCDSASATQRRCVPRRPTCWPRRRRPTATSRCWSLRWSTGTRELIAGVVRDPQFGANVMLGIGGMIAEAIADVQFRPAPISEIDAAEMIDGLAARMLLAEFRGEPAVDRRQLTAVLFGLSALVDARDPTSSRSTSIR